MVDQLLDVWRTVGSVVLAILILLVMITVHEFGHYVAGKILKFKIDEFSIGFGPALFKKKKKNGEIFSLRLIPLGGYCAFHGEDGLETEQPPMPEPFPETAQEDGHRENEHIELTLPPQDGEEPFAAAQADETATAGGQTAPSLPAQSDSLDAASSTDGGSARKHRVPEWKQKPDDGSFTRKAPWKRLIVLVAGAFMNYVLALVVIMICFFAYGQSMIGAARVEESGEIPAEYCLQAGDVFLEAEGRKLYLPTDIALALNGKKKGDHVVLTLSRIDPETEERSVMKAEIELRADVTVTSSADTDCVWKALGVEYIEDGDASGYALGYRIFQFGFFETVGRSFVYSWKIAGSIFRVLGELLTGRLGLSAFGGPVTTITMTSQIASSSFRSFLEITGFIGVNLAVFNLLPIPALDGSKVVFTVIEWVRGKPISRKVEAVIHAVGFVLLLGFAVLVDILQFI